MNQDKITKSDRIFIYKHRDRRNIIYSKTHKIYKIWNFIYKEYKKKEKNRIFLNLLMAKHWNSKIVANYKWYISFRNKYILFYKYIDNENKSKISTLTKFHIFFSLKKNKNIKKLVKKYWGELNLINEMKIRCFWKGELDTAPRFDKKYLPLFITVYKKIFQSINRKTTIIHWDAKPNNQINGILIDFDHLKIWFIEYDIGRYLARKKTYTLKEVLKNIHQTSNLYNKRLVTNLYFHNTLTFLAQSLWEKKKDMISLYTKRLKEMQKEVDLDEELHKIIEKVLWK